MAATSTLEKSTEFAGDYKLLRVTYTPTATSESVVITAATHGITEIMAVFPKLSNPPTNAGSACTNIYATFSGLTITVVTSNSSAAAATAWTGVTGELLIIGR